MRRDPKFLQTLREAAQKAARDLETLKLSQAETSGGVTNLRRELQGLLIQTHKRFVSDAKSIGHQAKVSSARHKGELVEMKKTAREAATRFLDRKNRERTEAGSK